MTHSIPARSAENIDVAYVANLARIQLTGDERATFQAQLTQIVDYVKELEHVDVSAIEPMAYTERLANVLRRDEARAGLDRQVVLDMAPAHDNEQFLVPKIV